MLDSIKSEKVLKDNSQFLSIKALFENGNVRKMRDIEKLFPTLIATSLRMNHGRYIQKLYKPEEFTIKQIIKLASLLSIDAKVITDVILFELNKNVKENTRVRKG